MKKFEFTISTPNGQRQMDILCETIKEAIAEITKLNYTIIRLERERVISFPFVDIYTAKT